MNGPDDGSDPLLQSGVASVEEVAELLAERRQISLFSASIQQPATAQPTAATIIGGTVRYDGSDGADDIVIERDAAPGMLRIRTIDGSLPEAVFADTVERILLSLGDEGEGAGATDRLTIDISGTPFAGAIGVGLTDRLAIGGVTGLDGDLEVLAEEKISVEDGALIEIGGDLTLGVEAINDATLDVQSFLKLRDATALIEIGNAEIRADDITITAFADTKRSENFVVDADALFALGEEQTKTGTMALGDTLDFGGGTLTRTGTGSFLTEGFRPGNTIEITGTLNDGFYRIAAVSEGEITIRESFAQMETFDTSLPGPSGFSLTGYDWGYVSGETGEIAFIQDNNPTGGVAPTITRALGSFIDDGFAAGDQIHVVGSTGNDEVFTVESVTDTALVLTPEAILTDEVFDPAADPSLTLEIYVARGDVDPEAVPLQQVIVQEGGLGFPGVVTFSAAGDTIARTVGSWVTDDFDAGEEITVTGSGANDGNYDIVAVTDGLLTLAPSSGLVDQTVDLVTAADPTLDIQVVDKEIPIAGTDITSGDLNGRTAEASPFGAGVLDQISGSPLSALLNFGASVFVSDADAKVTVADGATLAAGGNLVLNSYASSLVRISTPGLLLGFDVGKSTVSSMTLVGEGAVLSADGVTVVDALATNDLSVASKIQSGRLFVPKIGSKALQLGSTLGIVPLGITVPGPALSVAYGEAITISEAKIGAGTEVSGEQVDVAARNLTSHAVRAKTKLAFAGTDTSGNIAGAASVAINVNRATATTQIDGTLEAENDVNVASESLNLLNSVAAAAAVKDPKLPVNGLTGAVNNRVYSNLQSLPGFESSQPGDFAGAAAIAVGVSENTARTLVGGPVAPAMPMDAAGILSRAGDVTITAKAVASPKMTAAGASKIGATVSLAGGLAIGDHRNGAEVTIGAGAIVMAGGEITIDAFAEIPDQIKVDDLILDTVQAFRQLGPAAMQFEEDQAALQPDTTLPEPVRSVELFGRQAQGVAEFGVGVAQIGQSLLPAIQTFAKKITKAPGVAFLNSYVATSSADSASKSGWQDKNELLAPNEGKFALGLTVNSLTIENTADALVAQGAVVTAGAALRANSTARATAINLAGISNLTTLAVSKLKTAGNVSSDATGVAGTVAVYDLTQRARTVVADGAVLTSSASDIELGSLTDELTVSVARSGASAGGIAVSGTVVVNLFDATSEVIVDEGARLNALQGLVKLDAYSENLFVGVSGGYALSEGDIGFGITVSWTDIQSTTRAIIGDAEAPAMPGPAATTIGATPTVDARDLTIKAERSELAVVVGTTGAVSKDEADDVTPDPVDAQAGRKALEILGVVGSGQPGQLNGTDAGGISGGIGLSGQVGVVLSNAAVTAEIGRGAEIDVAGLIDIDARHSGLLVDVGLARALSAQLDEDSFALAGSVAWVDLDRTVTARIDGAAISAGSLEIEADRDDIQVLVVAGAGAASAAPQDDARGIGGSIGIGVFDPVAAAKILDSTITLSGHLDLIADGEDILVSVAGGFGLGEDLGLGAAVGVIAFDGSTTAAIDRSMVVAGGPVTVFADSEETSVLVAASAGIAEELGVAGSVAIGVIDMETTARIGGGSVSARGPVSVIADDDIDAITIAGNLAIGEDGALGIGIASMSLSERTVLAEISAGTVVNARSADSTTIEGEAYSGVTVSADAVDRLVTVAGGAAIGGDDFAAQGSFVVSVNNTDVFARIGSEIPDQPADARQVTGLGTRVVSADRIEVSANYDVDDVGVPGGLAIAVNDGPSFSSPAIGASLLVSIHDRDVIAEIGSDAVIDAYGDVIVAADLLGNLTLVSATAGVSLGGPAIAGAIGVPVIFDTVEARVWKRASVQAGDDIEVHARSDQDFTVVQAAIAGAVEKPGAAVTIGVMIQNDTVRAVIDDEATALAADTVLVEALSDSHLTDVSGGLAGSIGSVGAGLSAVILVRTDDVEARIGQGASVTGLALMECAPETFHPTADGVSRTSTRHGDETLYGVAVLAESEEKITGFAAQGAFGTVGLGGATPWSFITERTAASIGAEAQINIARPEGTPHVVGLDQAILIAAWDKTELVTVAGAVTAGTKAAVGVSADIVSIDKDTTASVGSEAVLVAQRMVTVAAEAEDDIVSVVLGVAVGGDGAGAGNIAVHVYDLDTMASIGDGADIRTTGALVFDAAHDTDVTMVDIAVSGGAKGAAGLTFVLPILDKTVDAKVGENAYLEAGLMPGYAHNWGHDGTIRKVPSVISGAEVFDADGNINEDALNEQLAGDDPGGLRIGLPSFALPGGVSSGDASGRPVSHDLFGSNDYAFSPLMRQRIDGGVRVHAASIDEMRTIALTLSAAGFGAGNLSAGVGVVDIDTTASVGDGTTIVTSGLTGEDCVAPALSVDASSAVSVLAALTGGVAGAAGAAITGNILDVDTLTRARLGAVEIDAGSGDVFVDATADEDLQLFALAAGIGGSVAVPAIGYVSLLAETYAEVAAGAVIGSAANVVVTASDETDVDLVAGGASIGGSSLGVGVAVPIIDKSTIAFVDGTVGASSLTIEALSSEDMDVVSFAAGAGAGVAVSGGIVVQTIDSDTAARLGASATVDLEPVTGASDGVSVIAGNDLTMDTFAGAFFAASGGLGAGVDVARIYNDTTATLGGIVRAGPGDVRIEAGSTRDIASLVVAGGGGLGALAAAVATYGLGAAPGTSYAAREETAGSVGTGTYAMQETPVFVDENGNEVDIEQEAADGVAALVDQLGGSLGGALISRDSDGDGEPDDGEVGFLGVEPGDADAAVTAYNEAGRSADTGLASRFDASFGAGAADPVRDVEGSLTGAHVLPGSVIVAGGDITVAAAAETDVSITGVSAVAGALAGGGSIGVVLDYHDVEATVGAGSVLGAAGSLGVTGLRDMGHNLRTVSGAASAGPAGASLAVAVSKVDIGGRALAEIEGVAGLGSIVVVNGGVTVDAETRVHLGVEAIGVAVTLAPIGGAAGIGVVDVETEGETIARIGAGVSIEAMGEGLAADAPALAVDAYALTIVGGIEELPGVPRPMATAGGGALVGVAVGSTAVDIRSTVVAEIDGNPDITVSGAVRVLAENDVDGIVSTSGGGAGALSVGVMVTDVEVVTTTRAEIGDANEGERGSILAESLEISAIDLQDLAVEAFNFSLAVAGVRVASPRLIMESDVDARLGGRVDVTTTGAAGVSVIASGRPVGVILSVSEGGGGLGISVSDVLLDITNDVDAKIDLGTVIMADALRIEADSGSPRLPEIDDRGVEIRPRQVSTAQVISRGVAIASITSDTVTLNHDENATATMNGTAVLEDDATILAVGDMGTRAIAGTEDGEVVSVTEDRAADLDGQYGLGVIGIFEINQTVVSTVDVFVGPDASIEVTEGDIGLTARQAGDFDSFGSLKTGGFVASTAGGLAETVNATTRTTLFAGARLEASGEVELRALNRMDVEGELQLRAEGALGNGVAKRSDGGFNTVDVTGVTQIDINRNAVVSGETVEISAQSTSVDVTAFANIFTGAVGTNNENFMSGSSLLASRVNIADLARLTSTEHMRIRADTSENDLDVNPNTSSNSIPVYFGAARGIAENEAEVTIRNAGIEVGNRDGEEALLVEATSEDNLYDVRETSNFNGILEFTVPDRADGQGGVNYDLDGESLKVDRANVDFRGRIEIVAGLPVEVALDSVGEPDGDFYIEGITKLSGAVLRTADGAELSEAMLLAGRIPDANGNVTEVVPVPDETLYLDPIIAFEKFGKVNFRADASRDADQNTYTRISRFQYLEAVDGRDGSIGISGSPGDVTIFNNTPRNLVINDIDMVLTAAILADRLDVKALVCIDTNVVTLEFDTFAGSERREVDILSIGGGDVELRGTIFNPFGTIGIEVEDGNLIAGGGRGETPVYTDAAVSFDGQSTAIVGQGPRVIADGFVGEDAALAIDMIGNFETGTGLTIEAGTDLAIDVGAVQIDGGEVFGSPRPARIIAGGDAEIALQAAQELPFEVFSIELDGIALSVEVFNDTPGNRPATWASSMTPMVNGPLRATYSDFPDALAAPVTVIPDVAALLDTAPAFAATTYFLGRDDAFDVAGDLSISTPGSGNVSLDANVNLGGTLVATGFQTIDLTDGEGTLDISVVATQFDGGARLAAAAGIVGVPAPEGVIDGDILTGDLNLVSTAGSVGSAERPLKVLAAGEIDATTGGGNVHLDGFGLFGGVDMTIGTIDAGTGDVVLSVTDASIIAASSSVAIAARSIELVAGEDIDGPDFGFTIDTLTPAGQGFVIAEAGGDLRLNSIFGDLDIQRASAGGEIAISAIDAEDLLLSFQVALATFDGNLTAGELDLIRDRQALAHGGSTLRLGDVSRARLSDPGGALLAPMIEAGGLVTLEASREVRIEGTVTGSRIVLDGEADTAEDWIYGVPGAPFPGLDDSPGGIVTVTGSLTSTAGGEDGIILRGGDEADSFTIENAAPLPSVRIEAAGGDDTIRVAGLAPMADPLDETDQIGDAIRVLTGTGADTVEIDLPGDGGTTVFLADTGTEDTVSLTTPAAGVLTETVNDTLFAPDEFRVFTLDTPAGIDRVFVPTATGTLLSGDGTPLSADTPAPAEAAAAIEFGSVTVRQLNADQWFSAAFSEVIPDAVVVFGPISDNGGHQAVMRVRNVTETGFQYQLDEWDYLDGTHAAETASWVAVSRGTHEIGGLTVTAGSGVLTDETWADQSLDAAFDAAPVVFAQVASANDAAAVTVRLRNVDAGGFEMALQEEEQADGRHGTEEVHWIAVEQGAGSLFAASATPDAVTHRDHTVSFADAPVGTRAFIAGMQTTDGIDVGVVRARSVGDTEATVFIEEEASRDAEIAHTHEVVGFLAAVTGHHEITAAGTRLAAPSPEVETSLSPTLSEAGPTQLTTGPEAPAKRTGDVGAPLTTVEAPLVLGLQDVVPAETGDQGADARITTSEPLDTDDEPTDALQTLADAPAWVAIAIEGALPGATIHEDGTWSLPEDAIGPLALGVGDIVAEPEDAGEESTDIAAPQEETEGELSDGLLLFDTTTGTLAPTRISGLTGTESAHALLAGRRGAL